MQTAQGSGALTISTAALFLMAELVAIPANAQTAFASEQAATAGESIHVMTSRPPARVPGVLPSIIPGPLINHGGPVQGVPDFYVVYWGWGSDPYGEQVYLNDFLSTVSGTPWLATVDQYGGGNYYSYFLGNWSDPSAVPTTPTDAQIQSEALSAISHFKLGTSDNIQVIVALPTGHAFATFPTKGGNVCAYHGKVTAHPNVTYTALPYMSDAGGTCGANLVKGPLDGVSILEGHELAETITDPLLNAWFDAAGNEIADKCAWVNISTIQTPLGTFAVQPLWSNAANGCVLPTGGETSTMVAGTQGTVGTGGFSRGLFGSMSPAATANGHTYLSLLDKWAGGKQQAYSFSNFSVGGFASDPGAAWLTSVTAVGTTFTGAAATYSYASGAATWTWTGSANGFGFNDGTTICTIVHK
jgi:hypothetical protein